MRRRTDIVGIARATVAPAYVKLPDVVRHRRGSAGAKTVVTWVPGDEAAQIVARWKREYP